MRDLRINTIYQIFDPNYEYHTRLEIIDLDKECIKDISTGNGFFIEEPESIKKDLKAENSIFSSKFGYISGDTSVIEDRYRCKCGAKRGRINHNIECEQCHTLVQYVDDNFEYFGWICLKDKYRLIHPNLFNFIQSFIGKKETFDNIIVGIEAKDEDGFHREVEKPENEPFYHIGMLEFYERFDEIMDYYLKKNPNKKELYDLIMENRDKVFTHSIPVYTIHLRPYKIEGENLVFEDTNAIYQIMAKEVGEINRETIKTFRKSKIKKVLLYGLQKNFMNLYEEIVNILNGKKGIIRGLFGGRYNFTVRSIIVPNNMLRIDQITLSYHALIKVLQQVLINIIKRTYNVNLSVAYDIWFKARIEPNKRIEEIIRNIIHYYPEGIPFIINRNPTLQYGSLIQVYCVDMVYTYTMGISLQILNPMGADFDGDCLNIWFPINKEYVRRAEITLNPRNAMYISKNDGMFNNSINHCKDLLITTNSFVHRSREYYTDEELKEIKECIKDEQ